MDPSSGGGRRGATLRDSRGSIKLKGNGQLAKAQNPFIVDTSLGEPEVTELGESNDAMDVQSLDAERRKRRKTFVSHLNKEIMHSRRQLRVLKRDVRDREKDLQLLRQRLST